MKYIITEKQHALIKEFIVDEYSDETLFKIIDKLVVYIYGKELKMVENKDGYLRFFSSGPVSPFHRNLSGRLWVDDDRLEKMIENLFGIDKLNVKRSEIPAVTHVDYSARIQTVKRDTNKRYYDLILKFKEKNTASI